MQENELFNLILTDSLDQKCKFEPLLNFIKNTIIVRFVYSQSFTNYHQPALLSSFIVTKIYVLRKQSFELVSPF